MKHFLIMLLLSAAGSTAFAQTSSPDSSAAARSSETVKKAGPSKYPENILKMNLSSLLLNNYNFVYERSLSRKISFSAGYRIMPSTTLGGTTLANQVIKYLNAGQGDLQRNLNKIVLSGQACTAEVRFYAGRKPGAKGFYLGLYGRYSSFRYNYQYEYAAQNKNYLIPVQGTVSGIGGGILIGEQFTIARHVVVDCFILGGHYGKTRGNGAGQADLSSMSAFDKRQIKNYFEELVTVNRKPFFTATVSDNGIKGTINGPFIGVRGLGLSLGVAF